MLLDGLAKATATAAPDYWVIEGTSFPQAGNHSAGVQRQYGGAVGKKANCQIAVSLHRADHEAGKGQPLGWRLYLPERWTGDPARRPRAKKGLPLPTLPQVRRSLQAALIHLSGRCPWCHTRFPSFDST